MNILTNDEYGFAELNLKTIKSIVVTSSCSSISPDYISGLKEINKKYKYTQCITCNSSIFLATNKLYKDYIYTKEEKEKSKKEEVKKNGIKKKSKSGEDS